MLHSFSVVERRALELGWKLMAVDFFDNRAGNGSSSLFWTEWFGGLSTGMHCRDRGGNCLQKLDGTL